MLARAGLEAVIFDVGGVLYRWHPRHLYAKLIADTNELDRFLAEVVTLDWHFQHDAGRPFAETSAELIARFPEHRALIEAYGPRWLETVPGPVEGMLDLVHALADAGVPLFGITNFSAEFWPRFAAAEPVFGRFADVIVSGEERMVKPDPAIFALARNRFPVAPARTLFVDDRLENVRAAEAAGYLGHHFTNAAALRARLGLD